MKLQPILPSDAPEDIRAQYEKLRTALRVTSLPLFFTYFGNFPRYLDHIISQIEPNLEDSIFQKIISETGTDIIYLSIETLLQSDEILEWKSRYRHSPSFFQFEQDLDKVFKTNMQLALLFLSLREAVKGWAVAARKLSSSSEHTSPGNSTSNPINHHIFIFEDHYTTTDTNSNTHMKTHGTVYQSPGSLTTTTTQMIQHEQSVERNLLPTYLSLCQKEFAGLMKQPHFWVLRVRIEEILLQQIHILPHPIHSPINLIRQLTEDREGTDDLLHCMTELFPIYAVQRLMYSGYMKS